MKALILIGGIGTRLRPLTCHSPKPLLPILNRPFLEYQFMLLKKHKITDVTLCVAYLSHEFENYFGSGKKWGLNIKYVHEKQPLGTAGAVKNAGKFLTEPTVIFNGDILTDVDLTSMSRYHRKNGAFVTISLTRVKDPTSFGLVETDKSGKIERFLEKPSWDEITCNTINAGIYIFEPGILDYIPAGINYSLERGVFPALLEQGRSLYGFTSKGYWLDIGTIDKYLQAHQDLMAGCLNLPNNAKKSHENTWSEGKLSWGKHITVDGRLFCGSNSKVCDFVQVKGNVCIGNSVMIGKGSTVTDSVILDGTTIGDGVRIENALIGKNCVIEPNSSLRQYTTLGNGTIIRKYSRL